MKTLIIGRNSYLVKNLENSLPNCTIISHVDVIGFDFSKFSKILLFSWSKESLEQNIQLILLVPAEKLVFISSVAVYSTEVRSQWAKYPNWKLKCENLVLERGGRIVRLGIFTEPANFPLGVGYPYTSLKKVSDILNSKIPDAVSNIYELEFGLQVIKFRRIKNILNGLSDVLPNTKYVQIPLVLPMKLVGYPLYSYTRDLSKLFSHTTRIGMGVLGFSHFINSTKAYRDTIFVSDHSDRLLVDNGFRGTRIGYRFTGLSKFWHGVKIVQRGKSFYKSVPVFPARSKLPRHTIYLHVESVSFAKFISLKISSNRISEFTVMCNRVVLGAGAIENCRLLKNYCDHEIHFSDHEIGYVGSLNLDEAVKRGYLKKLGKFIWGRQVFVSSDQKFMIDFRPSNPLKQDHEENIYNDTTIGIVRKVFKRFSLRQINEALFNKFGFGIATELVGVFLQLTHKDCITFAPFSGDLKRQRFDESKMILILAEIKMEFQSFQKNSLNLSDGIHISGGGNLLANSVIYDAQKTGRLVILGSPSLRELDFAHHTETIIGHNLQMIEQNNKPKQPDL